MESELDWYILPFSPKINYLQPSGYLKFSKFDEFTLQFNNLELYEENWELILISKSFGVII
jgi:hypothetical protein